MFLTAARKKNKLVSFGNIQNFVMVSRKGYFTLQKSANYRWNAALIYGHVELFGNIISKFKVLLREVCWGEVNWDEEIPQQSDVLNTFVNANGDRCDVMFSCLTVRAGFMELTHILNICLFIFVFRGKEIFSGWRLTRFHIRYKLAFV